LESDETSRRGDEMRGDMDVVSAGKSGLFLAVNQTRR
jgi:hypothetical protein